MGTQTEASRREATRAFIRYFFLCFMAVLVMSAVVVYAIVNAKQQHAESLAIRIAYCRAVENLKADNRADLASDKKNYKRNLRLLHLKDTPELRKAVHESWARRARHNAPKACPYTADTEVAK